jgi:hypothetical protein
MLSKCANSICSETFRYLHQGKIFHVSPSPAMQMAAEAKGVVAEGFWLCDVCSKKLTVIWDGAQAKVVPLAEKPRVNKMPLPKPEETQPRETAVVKMYHPPGLHRGPRAFANGRTR